MSAPERPRAGTAPGGRRLRTTLAFLFFLSPPFFSSQQTKGGFSAPSSAPSACRGAAVTSESSPASATRQRGPDPSLSPGDTGTLPSTPNPRGPGSGGALPVLPRAALARTTRARLQRAGVHAHGSARGEPCARAHTWPGDSGAACAPHVHTRGCARDGVQAEPPRACSSTCRCSGLPAESLTVPWPCWSPGSKTKHPSCTTARVPTASTPGTPPLSHSPGSCCAPRTAGTKRWRWGGLWKKPPLQTPLLSPTVATPRAQTPRARPQLGAAWDTPGLGREGTSPLRGSPPGTHAAAAPPPSAGRLRPPGG